MTINFALEYIPKRMEELGYGEQYTMRLRDMILEPTTVIHIEAYAQYFLLVEPPDGVRVESDTGIYFSAEQNSNERQYEHQGFIMIENTTNLYQYVRFIQLIPKK